MVAPAPPPADLLPVQRAATPMFRVLKLTAGPILHALFRIEVRGRENIPTDRAYVLIANHLNWLDSFAILAEFPTEPRVHFLGDTTILVTRRFQWAMVRSVAGFIPVNRNLHPDTVLFDHVNRCLQRGDLELAVRPTGFQPMLRRIERIANRLVLGMLASAFVIALAVLLSAYHVRSDPQIGAVLVVGFILASVLGVYVAWSILRSGRP